MKNSCFYQSFMVIAGLSVPTEAMNIVPFRPHDDQVVITPEVTAIWARPDGRRPQRVPRPLHEAPLQAVEALPQAAGAQPGEGQGVWHDAPTELVTPNAPGDLELPSLSPQHPAFIDEALNGQELRLDQRPLKPEELREHVIPLLQRGQVTRAYLWVGPCRADDVIPLAAYPCVIKLNLKNALSAAECAAFWAAATASDKTFQGLKKLDLSGSSLANTVLAPWDPQALGQLDKLTLSGRCLMNKQAWRARFTGVPLPQESGPEAWVVLGYGLETGSIAPQNFSHALSLYERSGETVLGQFMKGQLLDSWSGAPRGEWQNPEQAVEAYRYAADQDFAPAQTALGCMYERGRGVKQEVA